MSKVMWNYKPMPTSRLGQNDLNTEVTALPGLISYALYNLMEITPRTAAC